MHTCLRVQTPSLRRQRFSLIMWRPDVGLCVADGVVGAADADCAVVALPLPPLRLMSSVFCFVLLLFD